ncbi:hypothetical protein ACE10Z_27455 [Bradyrhizobium sp. Pha-3]|uniref:hypothetical protein n=1 Tax=Bradyrhizobium sp. Pha-3 TaxID=208375 RepID=UPI0035D4B02E
MSIITPILDGAALAAASLGDLLTSLLKAIDPGIGWFDDAAYDIGHDALAYLGLNASPAVTGTNPPNTGLLGGRVGPPALPIRADKQLAI